MDRRKAINSAVKFLLLAGILALYLYAMPPVFKNNDSPETTAAAYTLGIGHPPGYPLYAMAAKICILVPLANPAYRVNFFAVLLSMLVLVMTYFICMRLIKAINPASAPDPAEDDTNSWTSVFTCLILALSYIFWNQAMDSKGGIYILNLLFLSVMIYIAVILLERFQPKYIYLLSYVFGLSLTNHWPSAIILAPVFACLFILYFKRLKPVRWLYTAVFFIAGVSAYIYLPLRAHNAPVLNWGNPSGLKEMIWVILRKAYVYPVKAAVEVYLYQALEFAKLFIANYLLFFLVSFAGGYVLLKKSKKHLFFMLAVFLTVVVMVVFYNRTKKDVLYLMDIFLMPAEYIVLLLIAPGIIFLRGILRDKTQLYAAFGVAAFVLVSMAVIDFKKNDSRYDFISYDYGYNLLQGIPENSVYLASGDYNAMPVYYIREIEKKRRDIKFATDSFLIFQWGIDEFIRETGSPAVMSPYNREANIRNIISASAPGTGIFRNFYWENPVALDPAKYIEQQYGILMKVNTVKEKTDAGLFQMYNYRGIFERTALNNDANISLVTWYPVCMVNAANALMGEGRYAESIGLNKMALEFPVDKPEGNILYNIAFACSKINDNINEVRYLKKAKDKGADILAVYERLGFLYYNLGMLDLALPAFDEALKRGSKAPYVEKGISVINGFNQQQRYEIAMQKASEKLLSNDIDGAGLIFDYLLEKHYKNDIIYKNLGVYHFKTGGTEEALKYFLLSENETIDPGTSLYIAYTYEKLGNHEKAISGLNKAVKLYPNDRVLSDLLTAIKESRKNGKSTDSSHGPR